MALATLCHQIQQMGDTETRIQAFVVDHKARPESAQEAKQVVEALDKKLGSPPERLALPNHC